MPRYFSITRVLDSTTVTCDRPGGIPPRLYRALYAYI